MRIKGFSIILLLIMLLMGARYLTAGEVFNADEVAKEVANNVSEEYVACAAYYMIACEGVRRSGDPKTAAKLEETRDIALEYAVISAKEGRTKEMAEKVTLARLELNVKSMRDQIGNDISNISILINKHSARCKEIMEKPDKVMVEWTDKILRRNDVK
jgi:hypothetical protein